MILFFSLPFSLTHCTVVSQIRQLQLELSEKSHLESRMRSDLLTVETKMTHYEAENMTLRRRLTDVSDSREREGAQLQIKINSLETEVSHLMDELARTRRNQSSLGSGGGGYGGGYPSTPSLPPPSYSGSSSSSHGSYERSLPQQPPPVHYPSSTSTQSSLYGPPPSQAGSSSISSYHHSHKTTSSIGSTADDGGGYSIGERAVRSSNPAPVDGATGRGYQPRSLRGVLEQDSSYRGQDYDSNPGQ
jgi:hypothetical protein